MRAPQLLSFGARIVLIKIAEDAPTPIIGLLAAGATDTIPATHLEIKPLDLDMYLPMLQALVPQATHS